MPGSLCHQFVPAWRYSINPCKPMLYMCFSCLCITGTWRSLVLWENTRHAKKHLPRKNGLTFETGSLKFLLTIYHKAEFQLTWLPLVCVRNLSHNCLPMHGEMPSFENLWLVKYRLLLFLSIELLVLSIMNFYFSFIFSFYTLTWCCYFWEWSSLKTFLTSLLETGPQDPVTVQGKQNVYH